MTTNICYLPRTSGLYLFVPGPNPWESTYVAFSLTNVKVKAEIVDSVCKVVLSQTFSNDLATAAMKRLSLPTLRKQRCPWI